MRLTTDCVINGVLVDLFVHGSVSEDGEYTQLDKVVVRLKNAELFRLEHGVESGILMESELGDKIIESAFKILQHEQV